MGWGLNRVGVGHVFLLSDLGAGVGLLERFPPSRGDAENREFRVALFLRAWGECL